MRQTGRQDSKARRNRRREQKYTDTRKQTGEKDTGSKKTDRKVEEKDRGRQTGIDRQKRHIDRQTNTYNNTDRQAWIDTDGRRQVQVITDRQTDRNEKIA